MSQMGPSYDLGLFHKKADAKQACQDEQARQDEQGTLLAWNDQVAYRSFAQSAAFSYGHFTITHRPVR